MTCFIIQVAERVDDMGFESHLILSDDSPLAAAALINTPTNTSVEDDDVPVANLLGEAFDCACGDQLVEISVQGK